MLKCIYEASQKVQTLVRKLEPFLGKLYLKYGGDEEFEKINGEHGSGPRYFAQKGQSIRIDLKGDNPEKIELWYSGHEQPDIEISVVDLDINDDATIKAIAQAVLMPHQDLSEAKQLKETYTIGGKEYKYTSDAIRKAIELGFEEEAIPTELGIPVEEVSKYFIMKGFKKATPEKIIDPEVEKVEDKILSTKKPFEQVLKDLTGLTEMVVMGVIQGLLITGRAGTGKTYTVLQVLQHYNKKEGRDFFLIKGSSSPAGLYQAIYTNKGDDQILVLDDADSAFNNQDSRNILKAALDTNENPEIPGRKVSWNSSTNYDPERVTEEEKEKLEEKGNYPKYFYYQGSIIIISNKRAKEIDPDGAIQSRACIIEVMPSDTELMNQMRNLIPTVYPEVSIEQKMEVWSYLIKIGGDNISLRKLVRGIEILKSGIPSWRNYMGYI